MRKVRRCTTLAVAVVVVFGMVASGCKPPPKPKELTELNRILGEQGANKVKEFPGAGQYYRDSRKLRDVALEKYDERELNKARHYAIRGKIAYRTAQAIGQQVKANERLKAANEKIESINPEIQRLESERDKLQNQTQKLAQKVRRLENERKAEKRREKIESASRDNEASQQEKQRKARQALSDAADARQRARKVKANRFAEATYNKANNQLKSARALMNSDPESAGDVLRSARSAIESFEEAAEEAKPDYEEFLAKQNPQERVASLKEKLQFEFGDAFIESAPRGVRVVVVESFPKGASSIASDARSKLNAIAKLAEQFDEFELQIQTFTRKGNATENLSLSQVRARKVEDHLTGEGLSEDRIDTEGKGQGTIRYPNDAPKNDRIEVVFRRK